DVATGQGNRLPLKGGQFRCVVSGPGGVYVTSTLDNMIRIYNVGIKELEVKTPGVVYDLAFSPAGSFFAGYPAFSTASGNDPKPVMTRVTLWNKNGKPWGAIDVGSRIDGIAFSPDGYRL